LTGPQGTVFDDGAISAALLAETIMADSDGLAGGLTQYGDRDYALYLRRSYARSMGYSPEMLARPVVGIADTGSGFNSCHRLVPELIEAVTRGVIAAGALPLVFPTISLGEVYLSPTSLYLRNLMAMDTEEMIRAQPMDAVVLIGGCDKTVPAQLMGAISAGVPAIQLVTGPMMTGRFNGERLGACTDCRRFWARFRASEIDREAIAAVENTLAVTAGTCAVMGTASTMAIVSETLGMTLPGTAAIPAVHAPPKRQARRRPVSPAARWHRPRSSPARRSRTRYASCWRSAARPMRCCTWRPLRAVLVSRFRSNASTASPTRRRCWSI
jgi:dihydroxyacid dehydratase/phosphogluconate dehydratase